MKNTIFFIILALLYFAVSFSSAQSDFAPENLQGTVLTITVTSGSGLFAASGIYRFEPSITGNTYQIIGIVDVANSSGTYTYIKTGANTGEISFVDSAVGVGGTNFLILSTATTGAFNISSLFGSQSGTFVAVFPESAEPIFGGAPISGFPGWRSSPWYLNYNVDFWPWIYHDEHGWQFVSDGSTTDVDLCLGPGVGGMDFSEREHLPMDIHVWSKWRVAFYFREQYSRQSFSTEA